MEGLDFQYWNRDQPSLRGIDLELPAGAVVALVGENGAGKSTFVSTGFSARTAVVAVPVSVAPNELPSVDQDGVHPGGTFSEPGTYVWELPAPAIGSVTTARAAAPPEVPPRYVTAQFRVSPCSAVAAPGWVAFCTVFTSADAPTAVPAGWRRPRGRRPPGPAAGARR